MENLEMPTKVANPLIRACAEDRAIPPAEESSVEWLRRFLAKVSDRNRAQVTRLIRRWLDHQRVERKEVQRTRFPRRYTAPDIASLARVYAAHANLSGWRCVTLPKRRSG
jgi:hypothetical protein